MRRGQYPYYTTEQIRESNYLRLLWNSAIVASDSVGQTRAQIICVAELMRGGALEVFGENARKWRCVRHVRLSNNDRRIGLGDRGRQGDGGFATF